MTGEAMAVFDTPQEAFGALRPVCVQLTKAQTVENVARLHSQLQVVGDAALQELQEYVLFPLRFTLKTPGRKRERMVQSVVECVTFVLSVTRVEKPDLLLELFSELCVCLAAPSSPHQLAPLPEELRQAVAQALQALLHSASAEALLPLYQPAALPVLGFAVSLLLALAEQEKAKPARLAALRCLQALLLQRDDPEEHGALRGEEAQRCGDLFASFLPGIATTLSRIITGDARQGHAVVVSAIELFSRTVGLVMADEQLLRVPPEGEQATTAPGRTAGLVVHRGQAWARGTAAKLAILIGKVAASASAHPHWKARQALVEMVRLLVTRCSRSLAGSVGQLLKALVGLVNDDRPEIQKQSHAVLRAVAAQGALARDRQLADILAEDLHSLATALPRLMDSQDDQGKISTLNLLLGYVKLLGPKVNVVLTSASHLQRLSKALLQVLELEVKDVKVVEERCGGPGGLGEAAGPSPGLWHTGHAQTKSFRFFTDDRILILLQQICQVLGYYGDLYLLADHFTELYRESVLYRKQAALVLNELIAGAAGLAADALLERETAPGAEDLREVMRSILEEYVDQANWHLVTSLQADELTVGPAVHHTGLPALPPRAPPLGPRPTVHSMNSNIWQICIQLEGIGRFAHALGEDFQLLLISALYPVLEKAGDPTLLISQTAREAMADICRACAYASIPDLINRNADYLVNGISLHLRHRAHEPRALQVLEAMLRHSDAAVLPLVEDVLRDTLARVDQCHSDRAPAFLGVLHTLMVTLVRHFSAGPQARKDLVRGSSSSSSGAAGQREGVPACAAEELEGFFLGYVEQKRISEGDLPDAEEEEHLLAPEAGPGGLAPEAEGRVPPHARTAKEVLERCVHLLSDKSLRVRLKVLDVLELCVALLAPLPNLLLPLAHRTWPALVARLTNDDPLAVLRAFQVLCTLGAHSGDFLRRRFSKDVLPKLAGSLVTQAPVSARAGPTYSHTLAFKLQLAVLQGLGVLSVALDLGAADLDRVAVSCLPYLSAKQPARLQEAACSVFLHLMQVDPDATWLFLGDVWSPHPYVPPHPALRPVRLAGAGRKRDEFSDNVGRLLDTLHAREGTEPRRGASSCAQREAAGSAQDSGRGRRSREAAAPPQREGAPGPEDERCAARAFPGA
ncbi:TELO2-interacting protein 1 homolog isoform X2 [Varanus komodoensis]|uniref:TELO2-interacting protein 1 homolog isoform X2 n=1 Tax=Varanus komodoensis TaxID=61221 RepID=UPI001CF7CC56|nr:TELO2-interacting protein 1 homolog isoform X2 [Varanus komodoensis]